MTEPSRLSLPADAEDRLAQEMAADWRRGERLAAEHYLQRHPELIDHPGETVRLVYEEYCLRTEAGERVDPDELYQRFPRRARELALLIDCHHLLDSITTDPVFPAVGESLGDFQIVTELGRGSHGCVYLATQPALADRPVVLKVTPREAREHLSLAHLQHTHIIPLHAMYDFPARNLRALCMPYLGGATLARVLELLRDQPLARRTGQSLLEALDQAQKDARVRLLGRGGFRGVFANATYVEAICRIGACLADGLQHAHERGLVHLDIKPSNVLLAADAQPLLLDFHLAHRPVQAGRSAPMWFGGTPGYMSPEQERACAAADRGQPFPDAVDGRSDLYSLGHLLYIALAGDQASSATPLPRLHQTPNTKHQTPNTKHQTPNTKHQTPNTKHQSLHRCNPQVSVGLSDIIHKCLAAHPAERYQDAAALASDLRRHLAHRPLKGVANRSLRERWHKWRRGRPNAPLWIGVLLALLGTGILLAGMVVERYWEAQAALTEGQKQTERGAYREAVHTLARGKARVGRLPGTSQLTNALDQQWRQVRRAQAAQDLHAVAESLRFLAGADLLSSNELRTLDSHCRTAWAARGLVADAGPGPLSAQTEEQIRTDLLDLALFWAELTRRLSRQEKTGAGRVQVQTILTEAEQLLGPCAALARERELLQGTQNQLTSPAVRPAPWEHAALGQSLLRFGELERAAEELERATELRPQDFWANFYRGVCAYRRQQYADAVHSFGVAIALMPTSAECYYNRALAHATWDKKGLALKDYDHALALVPGLGVARLNRGILHYQEGHFAEAKADLQAALARGVDPATVHYNLALVHLALREPAAAQEQLDRVLKLNPAHAEAAALRGRIRSGP